MYYIFYDLGLHLGSKEEMMSKVKHVRDNIVNVRGLSDLYEFEGHHSTIPLHLNQGSKYLFIASVEDQNFDMTRTVSKKSNNG